LATPRAFRFELAKIAYFPPSPRLKPKAPHQKFLVLCVLSLPPLFFCPVDSTSTRSLYGSEPVLFTLSNSPVSFMAPLQVCHFFPHSAIAPLLTRRLLDVRFPLFSVLTGSTGAIRHFHSALRVETLYHLIFPSCKVARITPLQSEPAYIFFPLR